jgi:uncharacterized membrane protein YbaN (DUF454 family)
LSWRWPLLGVGLLSVGVGIAGVFIPGLPTTVFLLIAAWCFARSSPRFRAWLLGHRLLGPPVTAWHEHRAIPRRAKILAVAMMAASTAWVALYVAESWVWPTAMGAALAAVAAWIVTRPEGPPPERRTS